MTIREGDFAPGFALPAEPWDRIDVGSRFGEKKVVLLFFPLAFSSVCTAEMCRVRDDWGRWDAADAEVFAISVDSPYVTREFREQHGLPFPVLSDFNKEVARLYGVVQQDFNGLHGVAKRSVFVIDERGRVAYTWIAENPGQEPDYAALAARVASA